MQKLLKKYSKLPPICQRVLQIRSLAFHVEHKSEFIERLMQIDLKNKDGGEITKRDYKIIFSKLANVGLVAANGKLHPKILHHIAVLATSDNNPYKEKNLAIVKKMLNIRNNLNFIYGMNWGQYQSVYLAIYANDDTLFLDNQIDQIRHCSILLKIVSQIFQGEANIDIDWLRTRSPIIQIYICCAKLLPFYGSVSYLSEDIKLWSEFYQSDYFTKIINASISIIPSYIFSKILQIDLSMGLLDRAQKIGEGFTEATFYQQEMLGALSFFNGDHNKAQRYYDNAMKLFHSVLDRREWGRDNLHIFFYLLILLVEEKMTKVNTAINRLKNISYHDATAHALEALFCIKKNDIECARQNLHIAILSIERHHNETPFLLAVCVWVGCLLEPGNIKDKAYEHKRRFFQYKEIEQHLAAHLYAELVVAANANDQECKLFLDKASPFGRFRFLDILNIRQSWEYTVDQLHAIVAEKSEVLKRKDKMFLPQKRLIWLIDPKSLHIEVAEQRLRKNGEWTNGKLVSLKRFYQEDDSLDYLTDHDRVAIQGLRQESYGWYGQTRFYWDEERVLMGLIGHPLVFHAENRDIGLELVKGKLELQVETVGSGYYLSLPKYSETPRIFLEQETPSRYRVIDYSADFVAIGKIISKRGLTVPFDAKEKIVSMISDAKSDIHINSDVDDDNLPEVSGDTTCCVHLFPINEGIKLNVWIKPFGQYGHYYRAAQGQNIIIASVATESSEKVRKKVVRNFAKEKKSTESLINSCPTLLELSENNDEWYFESIETCLDVLLELEEYKKNHDLNIEWPKGQTLKLKQTVSFDNLSLSIRGKNDWFEYDGEIKLDDDLVLNMKSLLDLFDSYGNHGRFIKLADGEFIALTERFKKQLEELKAVSEDNKVFRLGTGVLQTLAKDTAQIKGDKSWKEHLNKLQSMEKHSPIIPSTLQATLREYQEEGFKYLSRLAHWEIGACLADDMGVGKTVQTIAMILEFAPLGPLLVVAPTSVCFNWIEELEKFAPTLNAHMLGIADDRQVLIDSLGKMDILICSYNLIIQSKEMIIDKNWQVVVLDEAQAIKNHSTQRWQCATKLKSNCRIVLTGTPIENHLGELWSIFRFLNPGLLGSLESFQNRYMIPIEKYRDPIAKRALKNLVCPYILRRTKTEVLKELPPKTEQSVLIEPTAEEAAFYEATLIKALQRIQRLDYMGGADNASNGNNANSKRFSILAEITRLRQACCHSSLVDENVNIASSKIKKFLTITKNLIENNHKALVFSQYVRYLDKIKEILQKEHISYQYLDGSTPIKARQKIVTAFQEGDGDLFLISLKAGGTGLNLTAADYVIILDPWWNPAVEEQASSRAHRIGQQRPVTVYRLIMKNSIEEKIIKLHKDKKDLANDLLSGSDVSGKITEEELMRLMEV